MQEISSDMPESERRGYQIVRLDSLQTVPGVIFSAKVSTGECTMVDSGNNKKVYQFGANGFRILPASRR